MRKVFFILLIFMGLISCGDGKNKTSQKTTSSEQKNHVEVLYFHGKQRCITCNAIEKLTKEVVEIDFAQQFRDSLIVFKVVDISTKEGEDVADKYEVTWSSLYINKWKNGEETRNNMTDFGFSYANGSPDMFKSGVKQKIEELLK